MRIVHLIKHCHRGNGHVHVAVDLACTQAAAGHDVYFASAGGTYEPLLRSSGVTLVHVPDEAGAKGAARSALAVARLVAEARPDVVHAHMMTSAVLARAAVAGRGVPVVTTMHNSFDAHSGLMRLGHVVVAVSEAERAGLLRRGFPSRKVVTVMNGAGGSPREPAIAPDDIALHRPSIVSLSGLHARKAVDDIIRAFALVSPEFPRWSLDVIGSGPDRDQLVELVRSLGLQDSVHFMGSTSAARALLEDAEIFVTATLAEPAGLSVMEARAAGCAVVATAVGGVPETLQQGRAGQLVPPRDPQAMAGALRKLMADPDELATWQERSRAGAEFFSAPRMAEDYLALYASLVAGGPFLRPPVTPVDDGDSTPHDRN